MAALSMTASAPDPPSTKTPLPAEHPLWTAPGMLITPHVAGAGPYLDDRRAEVFFDNCVRFNEGRPLRNVVDKARWF